MAENDPDKLKGPGGLTLRQIHQQVQKSVARLVLHPHFRNIQVSWVKLGEEGPGFFLDGMAEAIESANNAAQHFVEGRRAQKELFGESTT